MMRYKDIIQIYDKINADNMYHYNQIINDLNLYGMNFPVSNSDINIFESSNKKQYP